MLLSHLTVFIQVIQKERRGDYLGKTVQMYVLIVVFHLRLHGGCSPPASCLPLRLSLVAVLLTFIS